MNAYFRSTLNDRSLIFLIACTLTLVGCGGGSNNGSGATSYNLGGTVTGLNASLVLQNNANSPITVTANGTFSFPTQYIDSTVYGQVASTYNVSIISQPVGQTCVLSNASGPVSSGSNISNITVVCSTASYSVGGNVSGLTGNQTLTLHNGADNLPVTTNGAFTFPTNLPSGSPYSVTVTPVGVTCSVSAGAGTVSSNNISNILVVCSTAAYTVGGTMSGLGTAASAVLQNNNTDNLTVTANGPFTFVTPVAANSPYAVSLLTPPAGQNCSVTSGSGTMAASNVSNVSVTCSNVIIAGTIQSHALILTGAVSSVPTVTTFNNPRSITTDGTNLYVADTLNNQIRMIAINASSGVAATLAGTGAAGSADGSGTAATFDNPGGITTDGTNLYVADTLSNKIRQIVIATGVVSTVAGNGTAGFSDNAVGILAKFNHPSGITNDGSNLYVADTLNNRIRKIVLATGAVTTLAGSTLGFTNGPGTTATFNQPWGITTDGTNLYVADTNNQWIRQIVISNAVVTTLAGTRGAVGALDNTVGTSAKFDYPRGITTDGTNLYVADTTNQLIRKVGISGLSPVSTLAGTAGNSGAVDATGLSASFYDPSGLTTDGTSLYVADTSNKKFRQIK